MLFKIYYSDIINSRVVNILFVLFGTNNLNIFMFSILRGARIMLPESDKISVKLMKFIDLNAQANKKSTLNIHSEFQTVRSAEDVFSCD